MLNSISKCSAVICSSEKKYGGDVNQNLSDALNKLDFKEAQAAIERGADLNLVVNLNRESLFFLINSMQDLSEDPVTLNILQSSITEDLEFNPYNAALEELDEEDAEYYSDFAQEIVQFKQVPAWAFVLLTGHGDLYQMAAQKGFKLNLDNDTLVCRPYFIDNFENFLSDKNFAIINALFDAGITLEDVYEEHSYFSLFNSALESDNIEICKQCIALGKKHGKYLPRGFSNAHMSHAARASSPKMLQFLMDLGAEINTREWHYNYPIVEAIIYGNTAAVQFFLDHGVDLNLKVDNQWKTLIFKTAEVGNKETLQLLLTHGADPFFGVIDIFQCAIESRNIDVIKYLAENGYDINDYLDFFFTKYEYNNLKEKFWSDFSSDMKEVSDLEMFNLAIELGADFKSWKGDNLLLVAMLENLDLEVIKLLVAQGCDPFFRSDNNENLLFLAANDLETFEYLASLGLDPFQINNDGLSILFASNDKEVVTHLLSLGLDVNHRDNDNETCLFYVNNAEIADLLIKNGADVNAVNNDKETPLFGVVDYYEPYQFYVERVVMTLIKNGADITHKNAEGKTVYDLLSEYNKQQYNHFHKVLYLDYLNPNAPKNPFSWEDSSEE